MDSGSITVTITVSGVPGGVRAGEAEKIRVARNIRANAAQATKAPSWICFRRASEDFDDRAYGGGWDDLRGGNAKCIVPGGDQLRLMARGNRSMPLRDS